MRCLACESDKFRKITINENRLSIGEKFTYLICEKCHLTSLVNPPKNMSKYYGTNYSYHRKKPVKKGIIEKIYTSVSSFLLKPMNRFYPGKENRDDALLDIGCAKGNFLNDLRKKGYINLQGIEFSKDAIKNKTATELNIDLVSLEDYKTKKKFKIITVNQVFEHFEKPIEMLKKINGLIEKDGLVVMSFPNERSLARLLFGRYWPGYDAPRHYHTFNPVNIGMIAEKAGMKIRKIKYISRPSQFLGSFQYIYNEISGKKENLEDGFFRNSKILDLLLFIPAYLLNIFKFGDMIEVYLEKR